MYSSWFDVIKEVMRAEPEMVSRILRNEKERTKLYSEPSILDELEKEFRHKLDNTIAEKILGTILDKKELANKFIEIIPLYYDEVGNWWRWDSNDYYWRIVDETDILLMVDGAVNANVINSKEKGEILSALKLAARANKPKEVGEEIIQFKKELVNLKTGDRFPASSKYFVTNPIPFKLGKNLDTPNFDKLFREWVSEEDIKKLYQTLAYCLLPSYPLERIICLLGAGANGKSTFIKICYTFLGMKNICTTDLHTLTQSRFETTKLYKKLACIMAETDLASIESSQKIKKLVSGKDPVPIEFKHKGLLDFINYAKVIIATNNLPPTEDKTDGFYRRWLIIPFPNQFETEIDVLANIPLEEYENLAVKCLYELDELMKVRSFWKEGNIAQRRINYEAKSNPFDKFWAEQVEDSPDSDIPCWEFEKELNEYMKENHLRALSDKNINRFMKEKGIEQRRLWKEWYENQEATKKMVRCWAGIKWK